MSNIERINSLLTDVPDNQLLEVLDFLLFLKLKNDKSLISDIEEASTSSMEFWFNTDDEVWNYV